MMVSLKSEMSGVAQFYEGKTIFMTGGTGFMGKVMIEKLLMSAPAIKKIYVLIRYKNGEDKNIRMNKIKNGLAFQVLKSKHPEQLDKLEALEGDIEQPELGLSQADRRLLTDVNIVFNMAATLSFNEDLRKSVRMNVLATKALLDICLSMKNLEAFVHASTAYSNVGRELIEEKVYPAPTDLNQLVRECQNCSDEEVQAFTSRVLGKLPNTYILTKALAENVVHGYSDRLPIAIVRPSVVTPSLETPYPGWIDTKIGCTGLLVVIGSGILRVLYGDADIKFDIVPVDFTNNVLIVVAWKTALLGISEPLVYNAVSGAANRILQKELVKYFVIHSRDTPQDIVLWYPSAFFTQSRWIYNIGKFCLQTIPAYLHDYMKPSSTKFSLSRLQRGVQKAMDAVEYFMVNEFEFAYNNVPRLLDQMNEQDRRLFNLDIHQINWFDYVSLYVRGVRKYLLNQDDDNLPKAKQLMHMAWIKDKILKIATPVVVYYVAVAWITPLLVGSHQQQD